jgi:hypothetical protein
MREDFKEQPMTQMIQRGARDFEIRREDETYIGMITEFDGGAAWPGKSYAISNGSCRYRTLTLALYALVSFDDIQR